MINKQYPTQEWSSRWVFFMAATATAVGLGNIWKFPFIVAENGGSAFVILYSVCVLLLAVPLMLSEVVIGYLGKADPVTSVRRTSEASQANKYWSAIGFLGPIAGLLIIVLLTVVSAWAASYLIGMIQGDFFNLGQQSLITHFEQVKTNTNSLLFFQFGFLAIVGAILSLSVNTGLKRSLFYLVPMSVVILIILVWFSVKDGNVAQTYDYLFSFSPQLLSFKSVLLALEHAFYTLSVGTGALLVFGAYMPKRSSLGIIVMSVGLIDMLIALLSGFVVFPALLSSNIEPAAGFDLIFIALPMAYGDVIDGAFLGALFFLFVIFTALSSALVLLEPSIAWFSESLKMGRKSAAVIVTFSVWLLSIACWDIWQLSIAERPLFELFNVFSANILLPLSALLIALYSGWVLKPLLVKNQIAHSGVWALYLWYFLIRYIVPIALITMLFGRLLA